MSKIQFYLNEEEIEPQNLIDGGFDIKLIDNNDLFNPNSYMLFPEAFGNIDEIVLRKSPNANERTGYDIALEQYENNPFTALKFEAKSNFAGGLTLFGVGEAVATFVSDSCKITPNEITLKIEDRRVNFQKQLQALSLQTLYTQTKAISLQDAVRVGYVIETSIDNDKEYLSQEDAMILKDALFLVYDAQKDIANVSDSFTKKSTDSGHFVGTSQVISAVQLALEIIKIGLIFNTYRLKLKVLLETAFRSIRYYHGVNVKLLIEKVAEQLEFNFESSMFDQQRVLSEMCLLPSKSFAGTTKKTGIADFDAQGDFLPLESAEWLFDLVAKMAKGRFDIQGDTLKFEPLEHYFNSDSGVDLTIVRTNDDNSVIPYTPNLYENERYDLVEFNRDDSDKNTLINRGYFSQESYTPTPESETSLNMMRGIDKVELGVALAHRKEFESTVGQIFRTLISTIGGIGSFMGLGFSWANQPASRKYYMKLSDDSFNIPKLFIPQDRTLGTIEGNKSIKLNRKKLINGLVPIPDEISILKFTKLRSNWTVFQNQFEILDEFEAPVSEQDLTLLREKAVFTDALNGDKMILQEAIYDPNSDITTIKCRRFTNFANGFDVFKNFS